MSHAVVCMQFWMAVSRSFFAIMKTRISRKGVLRLIVMALMSTSTPAQQAAPSTQSAAIVLPKSFSICTDTNFQFPFSFMKNQQPVGLHIDIIAAALQSLGIEPRYEPTTWSSCLTRAKAGMVDAVATAAYMDERSLYMNYPADATDNSESSWRITQVAYKVITKRLDKNGNPNPYRFDGTITSLPEPVHVPAGYFIVHDLQKARMEVQEGTTSMENFQALLKDKTGSVIDLAEVAQHLSLQPEFTDQFRIQDQPLVIKSYYLAFSKNGHVSLPQAQQVWDAIAKVRNNKALMEAFLKKY